VKTLAGNVMHILKAFQMRYSEEMWIITSHTKEITRVSSNLSAKTAENLYSASGFE
jgi:hypothetical protein